MSKFLYSPQEVTQWARQAYDGSWLRKLQDGSIKPWQPELSLAAQRLTIAYAPTAPSSLSPAVYTEEDGLPHLQCSVISLRRTIHLAMLALPKTHRQNEQCPGTTREQRNADERSIISCTREYW